MRNALISIVLACGAASSVPAAGIPVIDVTAVANLIQQLAYWQQQISAMSNQLNELQRTHAAMTGSRGMQDVLQSTYGQRNYLPPNYADLLQVVQGSPAYAGLSDHAQAVMKHNAILTPHQLSGLSANGRHLIESRRRSSALLSALTQTTYQHTSQRFAALSQLITMIGAAGDQKAILDLQGRISAEQAMLTNEQTKMQAVYQVMQAQHLAGEHRVREQVISGHGNFNTRFSAVLKGGPQP
jgi:type IV secretion system protein VirB5